jgi:hypothetical protein
VVVVMVVVVMMMVVVVVVGVAAAAVSCVVVRGRVCVVHLSELHFRAPQQCHGGWNLALHALKELIRSGKRVGAGRGGIRGGG